MTARLHRFGDAAAFQPEGHTGVSPVRLTGATPDESLSVVLSSYEAGAHAERSPVALDTVYLILTGRLTISLDDEQVELNRLDSLFLPAGCVRAVENRTAEPASMFVIRPRQ
jgi:mannose-6-phosphate isomerase-like protein (cupin superfamily)